MPRIRPRQQTVLWSLQVRAQSSSLDGAGNLETLEVMAGEF